MAHPPQYRLSLTVLDKVIKDLKACGLEGIEVVYSTYTNAQERELRALALKNELHMTGGSDYHGTPKPDIQLGTGREIFMYRMNLQIGCLHKCLFYNNNINRN